MDALSKCEKDQNLQGNEQKIKDDHCSNVKIVETSQNPSDSYKFDDRPESSISNKLKNTCSKKRVFVHVVINIRLTQDEVTVICQINNIQQSVGRHFMPNAVRLLVLAFGLAGVHVVGKSHSLVALLEPGEGVGEQVYRRLEETADLLGERITVIKNIKSLLLKQKSVKYFDQDSGEFY